MASYDNTPNITDQSYGESRVGSKRSYGGSKQNVNHYGTPSINGDGGNGGNPEATPGGSSTGGYSVSELHQQAMQQKPTEATWYRGV